MSTTSPPGTQQSLTDALQAAAATQTDASEQDGPDTLQDDRVVDDALTCACGRPAGADGLCSAHRREHAGHAIGNHGGRL